MKKDFYVSPVIKENKPLLYDRMVSYFENKDNSKYRLRTVDLSITGKCNLKCKHCYASSYPEYKDLPLEYWEKTIAEILDLGAFHFVIQGGEALINRPRLEKIFEYVKTEQSFINLVSNGILLDKETLQWLKEQRVDKVCVSLDSGIPEEHDANRCMEGSHQKAVDAILLAKQMGFQVSFSSTISHENIQSEGVKKLFEFAVEHKIRMDIQVAAPVGNWCGRTDLVVTPEDSKMLLEKMENTVATDSAGQIYLINRDLYSRYGSSGCPAINNFLSITPQGEILPCTFIHISLGNIKDTSIKDALDKGLKVPYFKEKDPLCLCGEHREFIDKYLVPTAKHVVDGKGFQRFDEVFDDIV